MNTDLGITCHAWNSDRTQVVVANNTFLLEIYTVRGQSWEKQHTLKEHHQLVSAVDWHSTTNRIISCSHDRNVVVWEYSNAWKPALVNFYQSRGVLDASWSVRGDKFVVGTGSKNIGVGHWSEILRGWNTKRIKVFSSSVNCVKFDSTGLVVAAGSTDSTCKVITAFMEEIDSESQESGRYSGVKSFGEVIYNIQTGAWVNSLAWSPDSSWLVVTSHNSSVIFSNLAKEDTLMWKGKPFMSLAFANNSQVIAAGFDCKPVIFQLEGNRWGDPKEVQSGAEEKSEVQNRVKMMVKGFDKRKDRDAIDSKHKNTVTCLKRMDNGRFSSSDIGGNLFIWTI